MLAGRRKASNKLAIGIGRYIDPKIARLEGLRLGTRNPACRAYVSGAQSVAHEAQEA